MRRTKIKENIEVFSQQSKLTQTWFLWFLISFSLTTEYVGFYVPSDIWFQMMSFGIKIVFQGRFILGMNRLTRSIKFQGHFSRAWWKNSADNPASNVWPLRGEDNRANAHSAVRGGTPAGELVEWRICKMPLTVWGLPSEFLPELSTEIMFSFFMRAWFIFYFSCALDFPKRWWRE